MLKIEKIHINHLRNDTHFQFHTEFRDLVWIHGAVTLKIKPQFDAYMLLYEREDIALKKIVKSAITAQIHEADKARDEIYTGMAGTNTSALKHFHPNVREAAARLKIVFDTYGDVPNKSLIDETTAKTDIVLKDARAEADASYYAMCERLNALALIESVAAYEPFIRSLNTVIAKFKLAKHHRHRHNAEHAQPEETPNH